MHHAESRTVLAGKTGWLTALHQVQRQKWLDVCDQQIEWLFGFGFQLFTSLYYYMTTVDRSCFFSAVKPLLCNRCMYNVLTVIFEWLNNEMVTSLMSGWVILSSTAAHKKPFIAMKMLKNKIWKSVTTEKCHKLVWRLQVVINGALTTCGAWSGKSAAVALWWSLTSSRRERYTWSL